MTGRVWITGATYRDCDFVRRKYVPDVDRRRIVMLSRAAGPMRTVGLRIRRDDRAFDVSGEITLEQMASHLATDQGLSLDSVIDAAAFFLEPVTTS